MASHVRIARVPGLRELRRFIRRHPDKVLHIIVVIAVSSPQEWGNYKKHYRLEEVPWPVLLGVPFLPSGQDKG